MQSLPLLVVYRKEGFMGLFHPLVDTGQKYPSAKKVHIKVLLPNRTVVCDAVILLANGRLKRLRADLKLVVPVYGDVASDIVKVGRSGEMYCDLEMSSIHLNMRFSFHPWSQDHGLCAVNDSASHAQWISNCFCYRKDVGENSIQRTMNSKTMSKEKAWHLYRVAQQPCHAY